MRMFCVSIVFKIFVFKGKKFSLNKFMKKN